MPLTKSPAPRPAARPIIHDASIRDVRMTRYPRAYQRICVDVRMAARRSANATRSMISPTITSPTIHHKRLCVLKLKMKKPKAKQVQRKYFGGKSRISLPLKTPRKRLAGMNSRVTKLRCQTGIIWDSICCSIRDASTLRRLAAGTRRRAGCLGSPFCPSNSMSALTASQERFRCQ